MKEFATKERMTTEEFYARIDELRALIKRRKVVHPSYRDKIQREYEAKLNNLSGETHMDIEDIRLYL
jgi:hypothetical protein